MVADMAADMGVHMVADMEVDKVAGMVADKVADMVANIAAEKKSWLTCCCTRWPTKKNPGRH